MPSSHLILCRPLLLLPPIPPSIRVFSNESTLHMRWPKYWSFSLSIIPSKEHPGLVSFRMDWLDLLAVQGTLKSLVQHHSSKASILRCSAFFIVQLSHPYMQPLTPQIKLFVLCSFDTDYRSTHLAIPGSARGKEPTCLCRGHKRHMFDPWVGKISWRRPWQPIPVFLSGEFHGQRSLVGYSPWGHKGLDTTEVT